MSLLPKRIHSDEPRYSSGSAKVDVVAFNAYGFQHNLEVINKPFRSKEELKKILFAFQDSGAIVTVSFDEPQDNIRRRTA